MTGDVDSAPFGDSSISLGLHPASELPADRQLEVLSAQARCAERAGFDGVTLSEHHAGFDSYLPEPLLVTGWLLDDTSRIWAAPAPLLLGLRNPGLVAEQFAWTAARHPGRVALGVAPGYSESDFRAVDVPYEDRIERFRAHQRQLVAHLRRETALAADAAIVAWAASPTPLLSATNSVRAVQLAADLGAGIIFPGSEEPERLRRLTERYRAAGGTGSVVWIKNFWLGEAPTTAASERLAERYRAAAADGMRQADGFRSARAAGDVERIIEETASALVAIGATSLNARLHVAGVDPALIAEQVERFGAEVIPPLRSAWQRTGTST